MAKSAKEKARMKPRNAGPANRGTKKGQGALHAGSAFKKSNAASKSGRTGPKGEKDVKGGHTQMRSENTINRLKMYQSKPKKDHERREQSSKPVRIQPDRRWFGNTRVIAQDKMAAFRETISKGVEDPFSVVLRSSKLPMSLLKETEDKASRMNLLSVEPFQEVFGKKRRQKRVKLGSYDLEGLMQSVSQKTQGYNGEKDKKSEVDGITGLERSDRAPGEQKMGHAGEEIFNKGTSRRIWAELYKVVDASDVLVFVLDARDPMGTRCHQLEKEIRKNRPGKHIVLLLNKVDLVPTWAARRWVQVLTKEFPTLAFHASITNPFGKNALLNLLRQFGVLIKERKHLTIGMIGYPNVGKSSVINTMKRKKVCKAAPVPGETRVWQYIALTKKLYMLDCPGIVPPTESDFAADCAKVLKGVVRAERVENPSDFVDEVLARVKKPYLLQRFKMKPDTTWEDAEEFLSILARQYGKLFKGGDPDIETMARMVIYDWQRGRIPFFTAPPEVDEAPAPAPIITSSSRSSTATPAGAGADAGETIAGDSAVASPAAAAAEATPEVPPVRQSLAELACSVAFDEEDRRGEPLPEERETAAEKEEAKQAKANLSKRRKRSAAALARARGEDPGEDAAAGGAEDADAEGETAPKSAKKKRRKKVVSKGGKPKVASEGVSGEGMVVQRGSMDWNAVVAEFGV